MKHLMETRVRDAIEKAMASGALLPGEIPGVVVEEPKSEDHGDYATTVALAMAKTWKMPPRNVAGILLAHFGNDDGLFSRLEIAGPGFLNATVAPSAWADVLHTVHSLGSEYGKNTLGAGQKIMVEFVSANPTGPLHVGHGRGAAVGDAMANILRHSGFDVTREYYINDSGRQIRTLGRSTYLRLKELAGQTVEFPGDCYQGDYIREIARAVREETPGILSMDEDAAVMLCARRAADIILEGIRQDLCDFGVTHDIWFSEQSLYDSGAVDAALESFKQTGQVYLKDGAWWFATSALGDEKDRVVIRQNGLTTYFASDIAYHQNKYARGFDKVIDVWGADHHGYIPRLAAAVEASGIARERFSVILVKLVNLLRGGEQVAMSTRSGEFVTLREVMDEVGPDMARFIFLSRHHESPLDFDLEAAKSQEKDNPVFYIQYAHARIASIFKLAGERGIPMFREKEPSARLLTEPEETRVLKKMAQYPEVVERAALFQEPHRVAFFLTELAALFHAFYNQHRVLTEDPELCRARLYLAEGVRVLVHGGLSLLGVKAPEHM
jgi:arginyl-tRNA synthetase